MHDGVFATLFLKKRFCALFLKVLDGKKQLHRLLNMGPTMHTLPRVIVICATTATRVTTRYHNSIDLSIKANGAHFL